jgi:Domain of unknown function (DUF1707)
MDERQMIRASDSDRELVVERLKTALQDGCLKMDEYMARMGLAYEAVTRADLARLDADLPAAVKAGKTPATVALPQPDPGHHGVFASLPTALKVLWTIWLVPVFINVVVWVLVSGTKGHLVYPWPLWVAGPAGAALLAVSVGVKAMHHGRTAPRQLPRA